ncbi:MAG: 3-deoxy-D-manno-octulosonic acid transferase [Deltaproteobacteria bacterium]|nr:3-deoxy-D-manno-octulosonic acid transferase [Deltaproteobacteria bacterium]MBW1951160.1 3-deoxy-D-manno-octulosonic acid transferase [Deltaproteobacteria bacterium]MBW2008201.1 3-deoxy-D-manno-octulosonic acid transferase [Deltaproteobacteria bacterium]MBW2349384.1 3-deoxy-D-manno-octulosonic acid transferase [Deltaproteobacteria bacterium]
MAFDGKSHLLMGAYTALWKALSPALLISTRLREGRKKRLLEEAPKGPFDVWIQAASVGEAYLALEIAAGFKERGPRRLLLTSGTSQGVCILDEGIQNLEPGLRAGTRVTYFPFDAPHLMRRAVAYWRPRVMVLVETELWPGHLSACREADVTVLLVNGRLSEKSFRAYGKMRRFWRRVGPKKVLAVSGRDADRFSRLLGAERVGLMHNIKFDRLNLDEDPGAVADAIRGLLPSGCPFLVLGSVRKEEESDIEKLAPALLRDLPELVIGLFPRHAHRLKAWERRLDAGGVSWVYRSSLRGPVKPGSLILWDTFGELSAAYASAGAAFVGGSLRPCGGQNFLEALAQGVSPCIGPHWDNFRWVGEEVVTKGLVRCVKDITDLREALMRDLRNPRPREVVVEEMRAYLSRRRGGTATACRAIERALL